MQKKAILLVDDSILIIERITEILKDLDNLASISQVQRYSEARAFLERERPDIVLLDINLPDASGIELLRFIKKTHPSIVVIMFSNQANEYYIDLCKRLGADYFIDKSKGHEQLPDIIASLS